MRTYIPLREKVIVKVLNEEVSAGGIVVVHKDMEKEEGILLAIGKACFYDTDGEDLKVGDKVAFARYAGKVLDEEGMNQIRTMRDIDLLCKIED